MLSKLLTGNGKRVSACELTTCSLQSQDRVVGLFCLAIGPLDTALHRSALWRGRTPAPLDTTSLILGNAMNFTLCLPKTHSKVLVAVSIIAMLVPAAIQMHNHWKSQIAPAVRDSWPARVTGVAYGDWLNIRSGPGAGTDRVGTISREGTGITVYGCTNTPGHVRWCEIEHDQVRGWVKGKFLEPTR